MSLEQTQSLMQILFNYNEKISKLQQGVLLSKELPKLETWIKERMINGDAFNTIRMYLYALMKFLSTVNEITKDEIINYLHEMILTGKKTSTVIASLAIRSYLKYKGDSIYNEIPIPTMKEESDDEKEKKNLIKNMSIIEIKQILQSFRDVVFENERDVKTRMRNYVFFLILADTGMRSSELLWTSTRKIEQYKQINILNLDERYIKIRKTKTGSGKRYVIFSKIIKNTINNYIEEYEIDGFLFPSPFRNDVPISYKNMQYVWRRHALRLGKTIWKYRNGSIPTIHSLRHAWNTLSMENGMPYEIRAVLLGHKMGFHMENLNPDIFPANKNIESNTTMRYSHFKIELLREYHDRYAPKWNFSSYKKI